MARKTQQQQIDELTALVAHLAEVVTASASAPAEAPAEAPAATRKRGKGTRKASGRVTRWNEGMFPRYGITPEVGSTFQSRHGNAFTVTAVGTLPDGRAYVEAVKS